MLILLLMWVVAGQENGKEPIVIDETRVVELDGESAAMLTFEAAGVEVVTIIARTLEPEGDEPQARNVVADVLGPGGERVAYNDNHFSYDDDLLTTDAVIEKLELREAGTYTIRVNTYGGIFAGKVEMTVTAADLFEAEFAEDEGRLIIAAMLPENRRYAYTFEAAAGETLTATVRDTSGTIDPVLRLVDEAGVTVAINDDHGGDDVTMDVFDARLRDVAIAASGRYTLIVTDFLGRSGAFELVIERG